MKKIFSLALVLVAFFGIAQISMADPHCEACCYIYYEECMNIGPGNPQTCNNMLNNCINSCS